MCCLQAIRLNGAKLGKYPIRVMPSKTAIVPVNTSFLPRTQKELECCARTVYVANIDKRVDREDVRQFFETLCGEMQHLGNALRPDCLTVVDICRGAYLPMSCCYRICMHEEVLQSSMQPSHK